MNRAHARPPAWHFHARLSTFTWLEGPRLIVCSGIRPSERSVSDGECWLSRIFKEMQFNNRLCDFVFCSAEGKDVVRPCGARCRMWHLLVLRVGVSWGLGMQ